MICLEAATPTNISDSHIISIPCILLDFKPRCKTWLQSERKLGKVDKTLQQCIRCVIRQRLNDHMYTRVMLQCSRDLLHTTVQLIRPKVAIQSNDRGASV